MQTLRKATLSAFLILLAVNTLGQNVQYFRIVSSTSTVITAASPDGWLSWSNGVVGRTCTVERAFSLHGTNAWQTHLMHAATSSVMRLRLFDPHPPLDMVLIPGGVNAGTDPDYGTYSLTVESFYMGRYEVTKALWDKVKDWNGGNGYSYDNAGSGKAANHPVHTVSWYDVVKWCNARSQKEGRVPVYYTDDGVTQVYKTGQILDPYIKEPANGYRLPTDTQWEYAARGGAIGHRFPWSDTDTIQHSRANYYGDYTFSYNTSPTHGYHPLYNDGEEPYTSPGGSFASYGYGLYDIAGNVWEWCQNWPSEFVGVKRMACGGGWNGASAGCRTAVRARDTPDVSYNFLGFRTCLPAGQQ